MESYNNLSIKDLRLMCKERNIKGYSNRKRDELIKMLNPDISHYNDDNIWDDWKIYIKEAFFLSLCDKSRVGDIGKMLSLPSELLVIAKVNSLTKRKIFHVSGESYDAITKDDKPEVRIQIKLRQRDIHLENTRRNSSKNKDFNTTGHVATRTTEYDLLIVYVPSEDFSLKKVDLICFPVSSLIDPNKPNQLITRIPVSLRRKYQGNDMVSQVLHDFLG